ncbi:MAG: hypothetical protein VX278_14690, partial [Myxococcota bacterium]|nr:hypothetical protein [Myxococcota bacterium]
WGIAIYFDDWPLEEIVPIWEVAREQNASYFSLRLFDEERGRESKKEIAEYFAAMQVTSDTLPPLLQRFIPNAFAHADVLHVRIEQTLYAKPQIVSYRQRVGRRRLWRYILNGENSDHLSVLILNQR